MLGFIEKLAPKIGSILSGGADEAAIQAGKIQAGAVDKAIGEVQPFRDFGANQLSDLAGLITDPNKQRSYVENNPFFKAMADDAQNRLFSNQAARGKVGSGGTAAALQNSLLLLGQDLLDRNINQRFNMVGVGQSASNNIADLLTQKGNAEASGVVGAANARAQGIQSAIQLGTSAAMMISDRRFKRDIERIGKLDNGLPVYKFKYKYGEETHVGVMADEVEKVIPDAVIERNGIKFVNYEKATHAH